MLISKLMGRTILLGTLCTTSIGCMDSKTETTDVKPSMDQNDGSSEVDRTNTGVNVRDRDDSTKTPMDQNENKVDIKITADIRRRVVDTKMSVDAQNVKIITQDGKVTLRGPVDTAAEKAKIEEIAATVAGNDNVDSYLEIAAN